MGDHLEHGTGGVSRRNLIKRAAVVGAVAWTAPMIVDSVTSPAGALTLPPCIQSITDLAQDWVVDNAAYPGCSSRNCHRDVRLMFNITSCEQSVTISVEPVPGNAQWCAWTGNYSAMTKTVPANTTGSLIFPNTGDVIPGPGGCTIVAHTNSAVNDGIHVNPCVSSNHIRWRVSYGGGPYGAYHSFTAAPITRCP